MRRLPGHPVLWLIGGLAALVGLGYVGLGVLFPGLLGDRAVVVVNASGVALRDVRLVAHRSSFEGDTSETLGEIDRLAPGERFRVTYDPAPGFNLGLELTGAGRRLVEEQVRYVDRNEVRLTPTLWVVVHPDLEVVSYLKEPEPGALATPATRPSRYPAETLARLERLVETGDWDAPAQNDQGLLETVHRCTGLAFVLIPGGTFDMGSPESEEGRDADEGPLRRVTLAPFLLARTECTQAAWDRVGGADDREFVGERRPIERVSWDHAASWCAKAGLRLPTEAEWEYAARAGTCTPYWSGREPDDLDRVDWVSLYGDPRTHDVGEKPANPFGLHDVHGNVREWCADPRIGGAEGGAAGSGPGTRYGRIRGGSWRQLPVAARSAHRGGLRSDVRESDLGFRPAASLPE